MVVVAIHAGGDPETAAHAVGEVNWTATGQVDDAARKHAPHVLRM